MKNIEVWYDRLIELGIETKIAVVGNKPISCCSTCCQDCQIRQKTGCCDAEFVKWLNAEYVKPEIDWSEVETGTKVLVSDNKDNWYKAYFYQYRADRLYPFNVTAHPVTDDWSNIGEHQFVMKYCKLAEDEEDE